MKTANPKEVALALRWGAIVRRKFADAADESDPMGRRLIEHGATCYFNCARDLLAAVGHSDVPLSSFVERKVSLERLRAALLPALAEHFAGTQAAIDVEQMGWLIAGDVWLRLSHQMSPK